MAKILAWSPRRSRTTVVTIVTGLPGPGKGRLIRKLTGSSAVLIDGRSLELDSEDCLACQIDGWLTESLRNAVPPSSEATSATSLKSTSTESRAVVVLPENCDPRFFEDALAHSAQAAQSDRHGTPAYRVSSVLTVVDASRFWEDFNSDAFLSTRAATEEDDGEGELDVAELLATQVEYCDAILLDETKRLSARQIDKIEAVLRQIQPRARLLRLDEALQDPAAIAGWQLYHPEDTANGSMWRRALLQASQPFEQPAGEALSSEWIVFRQRRPFHPARFHQLVMDWPKECLRTFGTVWLATRNDIAFSFSQIGPVSMNLSPEGQWLATLDEQEKAWSLASYPEVRATWDQKFGDRFTELVFLGNRMNRAELIERLESCLLTEFEMRRDWTSFPDPITSGWEYDWDAPETEEEEDAPPPKVKLRLIRNELDPVNRSVGTSSLDEKKPS